MPPFNFFWMNTSIQLSFLSYLIDTNRSFAFVLNFKNLFGGGNKTFKHDFIQKNFNMPPDSECVVANVQSPYSFYNISKAYFYNYYTWWVLYHKNYYSQQWMISNGYYSPNLSSLNVYYYTIQFYSSVWQSTFRVFSSYCATSRLFISVWLCYQHYLAIFGGKGFLHLTSPYQVKTSSWGHF